MSLQKKYAEFQLIEKQLKIMTEQVQELNTKLMELDYLKTSLGELALTKKGTEILAPIGSGLFIKAELRDNSGLLVNVGSGTVVHKDIDGAKALLDKQTADIENMRQELLEEAAKLAQMSESLEAEIVQISKGEA